MANITTGSGNQIDTGNLSFDVFSQDQVFRSSEIKERMIEMLKLMDDQAEYDEASSEMHRRKNVMLREGINALKDTATIRRKIYDTEFLEKGLLQSSLGILKNTKELTIDTYKHRHNLKAQQKDYLKMEEQLKEMQKAGQGRDREAEKMLARKLRDEKQLLAVQSMKEKAMMDAHPLGPKMAKFLSGNVGMGIMRAGSMIADVFGSIFSLLGKLVMGVLSTFVKFIKDLFGTWLKIQSIIGNISADLGFTEYQTQQINNNVGKMAISAAQWGVNVEEAFGFMRSFAEMSGLNRVFLEDQIGDLSAIAKSTGLGAENAGQMYATMELLGMSTSRFRSYVEATRQTAGMLGLNITKVLTTVNKLLPAFTALNFKEGIAGLTQIVMKAQGLRFELDNMRNLAVQVFNPEGAVELAAKLRVLGGNFAAMADPFNLMLKGQTDAAGLMNDVMNTMSGLAIKNKDGLFSIPPVQQALLREFAAATGENVDNLIRGTLQMAKQNDIIGRLRNRGIFNEKDLSAVANMAEWDENRGEYMIKVDIAGTRRAISEINNNVNLAKQLHGFVREEQQVATTRMNLVEQLKNMYNMFLFSLQPLFRPLEALFKDSRMMAQLQATMSQVGQLIANSLLPLLGGGSGLYNFLLETGKGIAEFLKKLGELLSGKKSFIDIISTTIIKVVEKVWDTVQHMLGAFNKTDAGKKVVSTVSTASGIAGGLAGLQFGASLGSLFGPIGMVVGGILGGVGGYFGGKALMGSLLSGKADDFIMRGNQVQKFNKDDIVMGGTSLIPNKPQDNTASLQMSRDLLSQVKHYDKGAFAPLGMRAGGNTGTDKVTLNITGTLQIQGEKETAYLTSADLKNIGIQHLTYAIMNETDRFKNHQSSKKLQSEIITPIRST